MKIGHVVHNLCSGGAEMIAFGLARESALAGHTVDMILTDRFTGSLYEEKAIESLREVGVATHRLNRQPGSSVFGSLSAAKLWSLVHRNRYDVIHSHLGLSDAFAALVKRLNPAPFEHVLTVHNTRGYRSKLTNFLCGLSTVVYCSKAAARAVKLSHYKSAIIPNGIPLTQYRYSRSSRIASRATLGLSETAFVVISVGNLREQKNYDCAISGFAADPGITTDSDIHYLICGDGPEGPRLKAKVRELGLTDRIHFLGVRNDVAELMSAADLFLSASIFEGMPLSVIEAFAASLPCVLSPLEEHREIAERMPGVELLSTNSPKAIAGALRDAVHHRSSRCELLRVRAFALERFEIAQCASAYLALYEELKIARSGLAQPLGSANV